MKIETFNEAQDLQNKIMFIDQALIDLEKYSFTNVSYPIKLNLLDFDQSALHTATVKFLTKRRNDYQKQFDSLK